MEKAYVDGFENFFDAPTRFSGLSGFASSSDSLRALFGLGLYEACVLHHICSALRRCRGRGNSIQAPADATVPLRGGCRNRSWASASSIRCERSRRSPSKCESGVACRATSGLTRGTKSVVRSDAT